MRDKGDVPAFLRALPIGATFTHAKPGQQPDSRVRIGSDTLPADLPLRAVLRHRLRHVDPRRTHRAHALFDQPGGSGRARGTRTRTAPPPGNGRVSR